LPVIYACRENSVKKTHFDLRNFNMVVWDDPAELRKKLTDRIRATIPGAKLAT